MQRKLVAILAADVVGYSAMMADDETATMEALREHRRTVFDPLTAQHGGRIVKLMGDGTLVEFPSVVDAVSAALAIQAAVASDPSDIQLRIGINLGDVIVEGEDIYGDGVNVAARLEGLAQPGGICITATVHESLGNRVAATFSDAGEVKVKNIARPIHVYRWPHTRQAASSAVPLVPKELIRRQTISVSTFEQLAADVELGYFCEGLSEDIITAFGTIDQLTVVAGGNADDKAMGAGGEREKAHHHLSGTVRKAGDRIRVSAKLVQNDNGVQIWAERFDRNASDLFAVQDNVARNIVIAVHTALGAGSYTNRWQWGTEDFAAWQTMAKGFHEFQKFSPDSMAKAAVEFERALALDPDYLAPLLAGAYAHAHLAWIEDGTAAQALISKAQAAVDKALAEAPDDVRPYAAMRAIEVARGNHEGGVAAAERALAMAPTDSYTRATLAFALICADRPEDALVQIARAEQDMPGTPGWLEMARILSLHRIGDLAEAIRHGRLTCERLPDFYPAPGLVAAVATELDEPAEANAMRDKILAMDPQFSAHVFVRWHGLKNVDHAGRMMTSLISAGLPE